MNWLKVFSDDYANAVTAVAALGALFLAGFTLWYLMREFSEKYRPYVIPVVEAQKMQDNLGCVVSIIPSNVGPHPCYFKLTKIRLQIGDETYDTPDMKEWMLIATQNISIRMPAGHVNDTGVRKIREARYKNNRVEVSFILQTMSTEKKFDESKSYSYEINVLGENPLVLIRPEWQESPK